MLSPCLVIACALLTPQIASAAVVLHMGGPDLWGRGRTLPDNAIEVVIEDVAADTVRLTIDSAHLPDDGTKVVAVALNVAPTFGWWSIDFDWISGIQASTASLLPNWVLGFGPAGRFDVLFTYPILRRQGQFRSGQASVYELTGDGLDSQDFLTLSTGNEPAYGAFHALNSGICGGTGTYAATHLAPEPTSIAIWSLLGLAALSPCWRRRRRPIR